MLSFNIEILVGPLKRRFLFSFFSRHGFCFARTGETLNRGLGIGFPTFMILGLCFVETRPYYAITAGGAP